MINLHSTLLFIWIKVIHTKINPNFLPWKKFTVFALYWSDCQCVVVGFEVYRFSEPPPPSPTIFSEPPFQVSKNFWSPNSKSSSPPCHIKWTFPKRQNNQQKRRFLCEKLQEIRDEQKNWNTTTQTKSVVAKNCHCSTQRLLLTVCSSLTYFKNLHFCG